MAVVLGILLGLVAVRAPSVAAHHGSEDNPSGVLVVPPGTSAWIPIERADPGDTIQWTWTASAASTVRLSTALLWLDSSGREHIYQVDRGQAFGRFVAPRELRSAMLIWQNAADAPAKVAWSYAASAPFWRRPEMVLPALIPVFLLVGAYSLAKWIDAGARLRRGGTVEHTNGSASYTAER